MKKIVVNGHVDQLKLATGHKAHRSGAGVHRNKAHRRSAAKLRRELKGD
jgi:hypothetical protein